MNITGDIWLPGHSEYDTQRRAINPALDPRPSAVVEACGIPDVQAVVHSHSYSVVPFSVIGEKAMFSSRSGSA